MIGKKKGNIYEFKLKRKIQHSGIEVVKIAGSGACYDDKGDLSTESFLIECKHYNHATKSQISEWWKKIVVQSKLMEKIPVLAVKENYKPEWFQVKLQKLIVKMDYDNFINYVKQIEG